MTRPQLSPPLSVVPPSAAVATSSSSSSHNDSLRRKFVFIVIATIFVSYHLISNSMKSLSSNLQPYRDDHPTTVSSSSTTTHKEKDDNDPLGDENENEDEKEATSSSSTTTTTTTITTNNRYPIDDGNVIGILSTLPNEYFQTLRDKIDYDSNNVERCQRYGWTYNGPMEYKTHGLPPIQRNIFFGSLIANEPWELFEIIGAETYSIYSGIVFVESNRTQNLTPRNSTRLQHTTTFQQIFNTSNIQVRHFVNEDRRVRDLKREHAQRDEILKGWRDIGMKRDDIGILADADECQTRDFLRALQICDGIDSLDYEKHHCQVLKAGIRGRGEVYESSPECITFERRHWRPLIHIGHCIDYIGNTTLHIKSRYQGNKRAPGYGVYGKPVNLTITNGSIPIYTSIDFRTGAQGEYPDVKQKGYGSQTGYHFHNFFTSLHDLRFKYRTYGHPHKNAMSLTIDALANDVSLAVHCARNEPDPTDAKWKRIVGGFDTIPPFKPIYFQDPIYRRKRHEFLKQLIVHEDAMTAREQQQQNSTNS